MQFGIGTELRQQIVIITPYFQHMLEMPVKYNGSKLGWIESCHITFMILGAVTNVEIN